MTLSAATQRCPQPSRGSGASHYAAAAARGTPARRRALSAWLASALLLISCAAAAAQTFYKWTDDQGVVHFSDEPPAQAKHVEERKLPAVPAAASAVSPPEAATPEPGKEVTPPAKSETPSEGDVPGTGAPATTFTGPARVIMVTREAPRISPRALHIFGQVRNVGGVDAHRVVVTISAVDAAQGTPCLQEETPVVPGTLRPGEIGQYDVDVDSPCLLGEPPVDVEPVWQ